MRQLHLTNSSIFNMPHGPKTAICITTNGIIKKNGEAVMGAGVAKSATKHYQGIARTLANQLRQHGNHVFYLGNYNTTMCGNHVVFSFPTKHDWKDPSDINLIIQSAHELVQICDKMGIQECFIPRPGCNNGRLNWNDVCRAIEPILDNRFIIITQSKFD